MTPEQINIAIAKHCGFNPAYHVRVDWQYRMTDTKEKCEEWIAFMKGSCCRGEANRDYELLEVYPDFFNDLNAIREAVFLEEPKWDDWNIHLFHHRLWTMTRPKSTYTATATQWCEAFLRTVGKWEDGE